MRTMMFLLVLWFGSSPRVAQAQNPGRHSAEAAILETVRRYNAALQTGDPDVVAPFWAEEYVFINPAGERLTKEQRIQNLRDDRTTFDSLTTQSQNEKIQLYGNTAVYQAVLRIAGRYSGKDHVGVYRALVVMVRRQSRWLQVASQLTTIGSP